jgi:hypothetical protein
MMKNTFLLLLLPFFSQRLLHGHTPYSSTLMMIDQRRGKRFGLRSAEDTNSQEMR